MRLSVNFASPRARREADLFLADLLGRPLARRRAPRSPSPPSPDFGEQIELPMRTGRRVTDTPVGPDDNRREDVLSLLDRMHTMWAITNDAYANQAILIRLLPAGSQVPQRIASPPAAALAAGITAPWSFVPTIDAIRRCSEPTLAAAVITRYMAVPVTDSVGRGMRNLREDVLVVMDRLNFLFRSLVPAVYSAYPSERAAVAALAARTRVADHLLPGTFVEIERLKLGLATGRLGLVPLQADEREYGGADRYAARTGVVGGDTMPSVIIPPRTAAIPFPKLLSVFIPSGAPADRNNVHLFFTPFFEPKDFVAQQGLRAQHDAGGWILIGVPGLPEDATPNTVTITTAEIQRCLSAAGRGTTIHAIRMSGHSRGNRGVAWTINPARGAAPLVDLALVERVTMFDASYAQLGRALRQRLSGLTRMQRPGHPTQLAPGAVRLVDITVTNVSGFPGIALPGGQIRGLAYARMVEQGIARGEISTGSLSALSPSLGAATGRLLRALPTRGRFSTRTPTPPGMTDLAGFLSANARDLGVVQAETTGLFPFVSGNRLDGGTNSWHLDAHHWIAVELAHECVD